ncbi:MAG: hypothetical protein IKN78_08300, partial [Bacteroidales bacterium]|nr:hypothetical protein [Bacteroidales bacterium]
MSLNGGDSASSYRHWRNGALHSRGKRGKTGGGWRVTGNGTVFPAARLSLPISGTAHHSVWPGRDSHNPAAPATTADEGDGQGGAGQTESPAE